MPEDRRGAALELGAIAALTVATYAALLAAQRALWRNGLGPDGAAAYPRPDADVAAGAGQTAAVVGLGVAACLLLLWLVARAPRFQAAGLGPAAVALPVVVAVGLLLVPPSLSIDAYSYLSHGSLASTGANPYLQASASVADTAYGPLLVREGWQPVHPQSPYGPLWTAVERFAVEVSGTDVGLGVLLIKVVGLLAVLGTAALVADLLRGLRPERRLRGVLLLLANPLVLVELVAEGHNDGLMALLTVLSLWAAIRRRPGLAVVALALAVLVKASPLPIALPLLVHLVARRRSVPRLAVGAGAGLLVSAALTGALLAPYWAGAATAEGLRASGTPSPGWSIAGLIDVVLLPDPLTAFYDPAAIIPVQVALLVALVAATAAASLLARSPDGLLRAAALTATAVLVLLPVEWPWYAALPCVLLPLLASRLDVAAVVLLALGSRLIAPIGDASSIGVLDPGWFGAQQALIGQTLPGLGAIALGVLAAVRSRRDQVPVGASSAAAEHVRRA